MKLAITSDLHGTLPVIDQEHDVTIINGDIYPEYSFDYFATLQDQHVWHFQKFIPWLKTIPSKQILIGAGNHDYFINTEGKNYDSTLPDHCCYLEDEPIVLEGIKFYFSPWCGEILGRNFPFTARKEVLDIYADGIPKDTNILVTHSPQAFVLDRCPLQDKDFGSLALTNAIKELDRLKLHCVGHIHGIENNIVNNGKYTTINSAEKVVYYEYK